MISGSEIKAMCEPPPYASPLQTFGAERMTQRTIVYHSPSYYANREAEAVSAFIALARAMEDTPAHKRVAAMRYVADMIEREEAE